MIRNAGIAIATALVVARTAGAATVDTPPLHYGDDGVRCYVLNNSSKEISGIFHFYNHAGVLVYSYPVPLTVPAHGAREGGISAATAGTQGFCRFEGAFSRKAVKLTLCSNDGIVMCAQAVHSD